MGAGWAFALSALRPDDLAAVGAFYGTAWVEGMDFGSARAAYLGHYAEVDEFEPLAAVRALEDHIRTAGRDVAFHLYPSTRHWFVEDNRPDAYDAAAARLAWERTIRFLRAHLA